MNNLSLRNLSFIIFSLLIIFALVFGFSTIHLSRQFEQIQTSWSEFKAQNNEKARLHNSLYGALGYGGMIHSFKNYILRKDFNTFVELERSLGAAHGVVKQYFALSSTPAERLALNDIQTMLQEYQNSLKIVREEIKNNSPGTVIDSLVKVEDELALRGLNVLADEIIAEYRYFADESNKPVLATAIRAELGYGGVIHSFKNYILRGDKKFKERALKSMEYIGVIVEKYLKLEPTAGEKTALADIASTLAKYKSNIELIDKGIKNNLTPEEIDAEVKINDSYALRGLETLDQDTIIQIDEKSSKLSLMLESVSNQGRINGIVVISSTIILAIFIFLIFTRKIINPVKNISEIMYEMAHGNLDAYSESLADSQADKTELGNMEASLRVFRENEIERRQAEEEIRVLALTDPLTGLANRNQFEKKFTEMIAFAKREEKSLSLLAIDLDDFKPVNDAYGHAGGDLVLKSVAKNMLLIFRETDLVARLGGDEFCVLMYGTKDIAGVIKTVEKLIAVVGSPLAYGKDELSVGISVGIVQHIGGNEESLDILMQKADKALYKAKQSGKNTYSVFTPGEMNN